MLRSLDVGAQDAKAVAALLLDGCGRLPVAEEPAAPRVAQRDVKHSEGSGTEVNQWRAAGFSESPSQWTAKYVDVKSVQSAARRRRVVHWSAQHVSDYLLSRLESLRMAVCEFDKERARETARENAAVYKKVHAQRLAKVESAMVEYLKAQPRADVNIPRKEGPRDSEFLPALFREVAAVAKVTEPLVGNESALSEEEQMRHRMQRVMQRITRVEPPPELEQPASPSEVLIRLLNVNTTSGHICAQLIFDRNGLPVVRIEPRDPVAALLLRAQAASQRSVPWVPCVREGCGRYFPKDRKNRNCCSERCANYMKVKRYRDKKTKTQRRAQHHAEKSQG